MLRILFLFLFFSLTAGDLSEKNKPPTVRVLLTKLAEDALVEVRGRYLVYHPKNNELIETGSRKKRARVMTKSNGIYWGDPFQGIYEIRIVPNEENVSILVNGIQYKGCVEIYSIGGTLNIVNEVDTENYLKSILGPKISQKLPQEAADAIAITERTHLFYLIEKDAYASWQVEAESVGYQGLVVGRQNFSAISAVNRTRNLIMHYKKKPFPTHWCENSAGRTVSYQSVFRKNASVPKGVDQLPSLAKRDRSRFVSKVPFKKLAKITGLSTITEIDLFLADKSKKVYAIRFIGPEGRKDISFFQLQKHLGESSLPSSDFTITLKGKKAFFVGYGKGNGVGLCVSSAQILAQRKASTNSILKAHFPGVEIVKIDEKTGSLNPKSFIWN